MPQPTGPDDGQKLPFRQRKAAPLTATVSPKAFETFSISTSCVMHSRPLSRKGSHRYRAPPSKPSSRALLKRGQSAAVNITICPVTYADASLARNSVAPTRSSKLAEPAHRDLGPASRPASRRRVERLGQFGPEIARPERVDTQYPAAPIRPTARGSSPEYRSWRRCREPPSARPTADVSDPRLIRLPVPRPRSGCRAQPCATRNAPLQIGVQDPVPQLRRDLRCRGDLLHSRVVDQDVGNGALRLERVEQPG